MSFCSTFFSPMHCCIKKNIIITYIKESGAGQARAVQAS